MDSDLKCNNLQCRKALMDKAVVTTCSHIFCVDCANELFTATQLCPACETHLSEPDDVVVSSLHPSNDYKTSVLSGLSPSLILEICGRAMSFWQYQIHQENSFQQAVLKNLNERNAQLQKQLDNVIREANNEISLMNNKVAGLEKDLEIERRKLRELQDTARERDKDYQKLKAHYDKMKRKALSSPGALINGAQATFAASGVPQNDNLMALDRAPARPRGNNTFAVPSNGVDIGTVVGGMEAHGIQRTPFRGGATNGQFTSDWQTMGRSGHSLSGGNSLLASASERSASADEVENILATSHQTNRQFMRPQTQNTAQYAGRMMVAQSGQNSNGRRQKAFRPSIPR